MFYLLGRGQRGNDGCQFCHGTQLCGARKRGFIFWKKKKKKSKAVKFIFKQTAGNLWEISASNSHPWNLNSAAVAGEIMLQMLLGVFFLSHLGQKIYKARSPSTEYAEYTEYTEYQLLFFPTNQKWGWIVPSLPVPYGLCSPGQVIVHPQRWKAVWKLHRLSEQRKKGMGMLLFSCRNASIPAGEGPGQCLDKTKQWRCVLGGESPWLCSPILGRLQGMWKPQSIEVEKYGVNSFKKTPNELSILVWIRCLLCIIKAGSSPFIFGCFEV